MVQTSGAVDFGKAIRLQSVARSAGPRGGAPVNVKLVIIISPNS